jgi:hypothetical protein|tara:strand:+ start:4151 stop:4708 length:558 start_codon:yes stop_codon:yes gene_type:complete
MTINNFSAKPNITPTTTGRILDLKDLTPAQSRKIVALNAAIDAVKADVPTMKLANQVSQAKAITDTMRDALMATCQAEWADTCYVCHKAIEAGEATVNKAIDPISNRQAWDVGVAEVPIYWQSRHAYHESFTNSGLGFDALRNKKLRDAYRADTPAERQPSENRFEFDARQEQERKRRLRRVGLY